MTAASAPGPVSLPCGDLAKWSQALDPGELARHVTQCRASAASTTEKGRRLEALLAWLLTHLPGVVARRRDVYSHDGAQEIDVMFWNEQHPEGFPTSSGVVLGECKNWTRPIDSSDVAWFDWKLRIGAVSHGILLAANGITMNANRRDYAVSVLTEAQRDGRVILVLTLDEIMLLSSTAELRELLLDKRMGLAGRAPFG